MSLLADISRAAAADRLIVSGVVHHGARQSIVLLSPDEPAFRPHFTTDLEWTDGAPDPMDRWSLRVITALADRFDAEAVFPFGGPPYQPFIGWAQTSGQAWPSPVSLLVHAEAGLFISYRGALIVDAIITPSTPPNPCQTCTTRPCQTACPVGALTTKGYDIPRCHAYLDTHEGAECLEMGCAVRRACPVGASRRNPEQSAYHMRKFHP